MANLKVLDGAGDLKYIKSEGAGTDGDPQINHFEIDDMPAVEGTVTVVGTVTTVEGTAIRSNYDAGPSWEGSHGLTIDGTANQSFYAAIAEGTATSVTDAPATGKYLVVTDIFISTPVAMTVKFQCETSTARITGPYDMTANSSLQLTPRGKWKLGSADKKLQVQTTGTEGSLMVDAHWHSES